MFSAIYRSFVRSITEVLHLSNLFYFLFSPLYLFIFLFSLFLSRLANGGLLEIAKVYPLDAVFDTPEDVPEDVSELSTGSPYHFLRSFH